MDRLPIDAHLPRIADALERARAVVVAAAPGAGKTTRVPPALADRGAVLLLQPRRAAARAVASRIAAERRWTVGREVGWQMRYENRYQADTRVLVATEGILTARLQRDPLLSEFTTLVIDEFHERSVHADLGLALARQAWLAREDFRIVVMSATLDVNPVAAFLGRCPVIDVPGRTFPIEIEYAPNVPVAEAVSMLLARTPGNILCFMSGTADVERTARDVASARPDLEVHPLHGGLDGRAQDAALSPSGGRRVVVATNIAETSVTVPGVTAVVDSGWHKVARYDRARGIDRLVAERIPQDAADQRAGRAGRTAPGVVVRLWSPLDRLKPAREPEIHRVDLSPCVLDVIACGEPPEHFEWFEAPSVEAVASAMGLLRRLGAISGGRLTDVGDHMRQLPLPPRLARVFLAGGGSVTAARACALLSDRMPALRRGVVTSSDVLSALDEWPRLPHLHQAAEQLLRIARQWDPRRVVRGSLSETDLRRALLAGYPDRVAQRRDAASNRFKLASGTGAALSPESGVREAEWIVGLEITNSARDGDADARIRLASAVDKSWLSPTGVSVRTTIDDAGVVRTVSRTMYDALELSQAPAAVDFEEAAALLRERWRSRSRSDADERLLHRLAFAGADITLDALLDVAVLGKRALSDVTLAAALPRDLIVRLSRDAPETLTVPSGRAVRLEYGADGTVTAEVKLQELFGLGETPRLGPRREPVLFSLLAPNGRPVQMTRDLRSFWTRTYPEIRKELRGRYPKHPWPEDPWTAVPTARTVRR